MLSTFLSRRCTPTSCIADYSVQQAIKELWISGQLTCSNWNKWKQHLAILTVSITQVSATSSTSNILALHLFALPQNTTLMDPLP